MSLRTICIHFSHTELGRELFALVWKTSRHYVAGVNKGVQCRCWFQKVIFGFLILKRVKTTFIMVLRVLSVPMCVCCDSQYPSQESTLETLVTVTLSKLCVYFQGKTSQENSLLSPETENICQSTLTFRIFTFQQNR